MPFAADEPISQSDWRVRLPAVEQSQRSYRRRSTKKPGVFRTVVGDWTSSRPAAGLPAVQRTRSARLQPLVQGGVAYAQLAGGPALVAAEGVDHLLQLGRRHRQ